GWSAAAHPGTCAMNRGPGIAAIHAAEARIEQSRRDAREGLARAEAAFRTNLSQPSTLALAAMAGGMLALWLARRRGSGSGRQATVRTFSTLGLAAAATLRYGMQYLPLVVRFVRPPAGDAMRSGG
ncbi:MAG: hypothetical protein ABI661_07100, partial [Gammaproteobacteria bacterium]